MRFQSVHFPHSLMKTAVNPAAGVLDLEKCEMVRTFSSF